MTREPVDLGWMTRASMITTVPVRLVSPNPKSAHVYIGPNTVSVEGPDARDVAHAIQTLFTEAHDLPERVAQVQRDADRTDADDVPASSDDNPDTTAAVATLQAWYREHRWAKRVTRKLFDAAIRHLGTALELLTAAPPAAPAPAPAPALLPTVTVVDADGQAWLVQDGRRIAVFVQPVDAAPWRNP